MRRQRGEARLGLFDRRKHRAEPAVKMKGQIDAEEDHDDEDHGILGHCGPGRTVHPRNHHIGGDHGGADPDRDGRGDRAVAGDFDDDAEPLELEHEVGDERHDIDKGDDDAERRTVIFAHEEVGLGIEPVLLRITPDRRKHEIGQHIGERAVAENVIGRRALAVSEAAAAEEGERGVDFPGQQHEHEDGTETAAADGPLLEVHVLAAAGEKAEDQRQQRGGGDKGQRAVHGSSSRFAGSFA